MSIKIDKQFIPFQTHDESILIRKIIETFDADTIDESPHRHEFYEILYIIDGAGRHEIDGVRYDLMPNTLYFISKGQVHNFLYAQNVNGYLIRFKDIILPTPSIEQEGVYHNMLFSLRQFSEIQLPKSEEVFIMETVNRMLIEYNKEDIDCFLLHHLVYPILIIMHKQTASVKLKTNYEQDKYLQYIQLVEQSFKDSQDMSFYANQMGISKRKLTSICKDKSGKTAKTILSERVLNEAKRLLLYTSLPLKEISHSLGYKDLGYFCRYFKKATQCTPGEFKQSKK